MSVLQQLENFFQMKPGSISDPDICLGAKLREVTLSNGMKCWSMSSAKYVKDAIHNIKDYIEKNLDGMKLKKKKLNSICYHAIQEFVAMSEVLMMHIATGENIVDLATKVITNGTKGDYLVGKLLYDTCE